MSDVADRAAERRLTAVCIMAQARLAGLDANVPMVLRKFALWQEWSEGRYNTGYLMRATGVRKLNSA